MKIYTAQEKLNNKVFDFIYLGKPYSAQKFHEHRKQCSICKDNSFENCLIGNEIMESLIIKN